MGMPKADFSKSKAAVTVNLPAGIATAFTGKDGTISTEAPMLRGENGFTVHSLLTTGETLQETNGVFNPSTAASYTPVGRFDGIGAFKSDSGTVRVLVNHEIGSAAGRTRARRLDHSYQEPVMTSRSTALFAFLGLAAVPALQNPWPQPEGLSERWSERELPDGGFRATATGAAVSCRLVPEGADGGAP